MKFIEAGFLETFVDCLLALRAAQKLTKLLDFPGIHNSFSSEFFSQAFCDFFFVGEVDWSSIKLYWHFGLGKRFYWQGGFFWNNRLGLNFFGLEYFWLVSSKCLLDSILGFLLPHIF